MMGQNQKNHNIYLHNGENLKSQVNVDEIIDKSSAFMEPEVSLPYSQKPTFGESNVSCSYFYSWKSRVGTEKVSFCSNAFDLYLGGPDITLDKNTD
jgi:hypothetical protein